MDYPRLPRFKRAPAVAPIQLTERDHDIIRLVHRHHFLRSRQIVALIGGSSQQLLRRLQLLYHHGYLERPRAQIDYYHQGGTRHIVYGLGNKGGALLRQELGIPGRKIPWGEKNRAVRGMFLEHALLVTDVMVTLELACRETKDIRLLSEDEFSLQGKMSGERQPFQWKVKMNSGLKLGVIPDRVFALEFSDQSGGSNRAYFFLEADRGTMPVTRRTLSQTSFYRKLLAYEATWSQSIHSTKFGFNRFRVLTVTTSSARVNSIIEAASQLKRGHGLFLFADRTILEKPKSMFSPIWKTGRQGETVGLLS
jgi:DNA-binding Lrp family transcriptional regulator